MTPVLVVVWGLIMVITLPVARARAAARRWRGLPRYMDGMCEWASALARMHPRYNDAAVPQYTLRGLGGEWLPYAIHLDVINNTDRAYSSM